MKRLFRADKGYGSWYVCKKVFMVDRKGECRLWTYYLQYCRSFG